MRNADPRAPGRHPLRVTLAYLAREKLHELRHPDRASLFGLSTLLLLGLWFEVLLILAMRQGFREIADLAAAQGLVPRDVFVSIYFVFLVGLTQVIILFGFARAQTVGLERLRFLPLGPLHIYLVELSSKLLAALGAVLFLLPLAVATLPVAGGGPGRAALLAAAALLTAVALAEAAVLLLLLIEGTTASGRIIFRLLFAGFVLGGYALRFFLPREIALNAMAARWMPWGIARRLVLEGDPVAAAALVGSVVALFFLGLVAYRAIYLGDVRVSAGAGRFDAAAFFRVLGAPLALAGRETHAIFRADCTQVFRNPLAFTIFASPAIVLLVLNASTGLLQNPAWRFRTPIIVVYLLTSLVGLNPIGRDGRAYPLLRLLPIRRRSELLAKAGLCMSISVTFGVAICAYYAWGEWSLLLARAGALLLFAAGLTMLASYLGIRRPVYGRLTGGPLVRFPFLLLGLVLWATAEGAAPLLPGVGTPLALGVLSAAVAVIFYPLALRRLERWRIEDLKIG